MTVFLWAMLVLSALRFGNQLVRAVIQQEPLQKLAHAIAAAFEAIVFLWAGALLVGGAA